MPTRSWRWPCSSHSRSSTASSSRVSASSASGTTGVGVDVIAAPIVVGLGQAERLLGDEVEDHLAAHRRDAQQPHHAPQVGEAVLGRQAVAAVGLDRGVERVQPGLGGRVLRHVGGLARGDAVVAVVVHPRGLRGHEAGELDLDLGGGERVRDALVASDRRAPHLALVRVRGGPVERVAADAGADRRAHDALGVQPDEHLAQPFVLVAEQPVGGHHDVVEEQRVLLLRRADLHRDQRAFEPGRVGVDDEERELARARSRGRCRSG